MRIFLIIMCIMIPRTVLASLPVTHPASTMMDISTLALKTAATAELQAISATEGMNAESLEAAKKETAATVQKTNEVEATTFASLMKQHLIAVSVTESAREFSAGSKTSTVCKNIDKVNGAKVQVAYQKKYGDFLTNYNEDNTDLVQITKRWLEAGKNDALDSPWGIFPQKGTIEDTENALAQIALLTNPTPPQKLNSKYLGLAVGQYHESLRKLQQAKLAIPQKIMIDIMSANLPAHDLAENQKEVYAEKGLGAESINNVEGKISSNAVIDMEVTARYGNAVWQNRLDKSAQEGFVGTILEIRELLEAEVLDLKMQHNLLKLDNARLAVYSQRLSRLVGESLDERKNYLRKKAKSIETN